MKAGATAATLAALGGGAAGAVGADEVEPMVASGNVDIFLDIQGVEGESIDHAHENEIDVLAWQWGAKNSASLHVARGGGQSAPTFEDLQVTKFVDAATPALWLGVASGRTFGAARLTVRRGVGDPVNMLVIDLDPVLISGIEPAGTTGQHPLETITLAFSRFSVTYTPMEPDGTPGPDIGPVGWDIRRNEEL